MRGPDAQAPNNKLGVHVSGPHRRDLALRNPEGDCADSASVEDVVAGWVSQAGEQAWPDGVLGESGTA